MSWQYFLIAFLLTAVGFLAVVLAPACADSSALDDAAVAQANNQFGFDLYGQLDKASSGDNLFFSPSSISLALAMTAAGAKGQTESEMAGVLHLTDRLPQAHAAYHAMLERWNARGEKRGYELRIANRLWGQKGHDFLQSYLTLTRQDYGAEMGRLDFAQTAEAARQVINAWVEKQTADKIKDLIPPGAIDRSTSLVLTNAIYFKGDWMLPFKKDATRDADFTVSAEQKVKVPLMTEKEHLPYMEDESLQAVELPYKGSGLTMLLLLPKKIDGLTELEKSLSAAKIDQVRTKLKAQPTIIYLPRFKFEASFSLKKTLQTLGMSLAFSSGADFSGMDGQKDLSISAVIHKAFVDVNETGTEAAAATGVMMARSAAPSQTPPAVFRADHPFVFMICDRQQGSILFLGRMINPPTASK
jgi:serpin B